MADMVDTVEDLATVEDSEAAMEEVSDEVMADLAEAVMVDSVGDFTVNSFLENAYF